jgi:hypothetical protein
MSWKNSRQNTRIDSTIKIEYTSTFEEKKLFRLRSSSLNEM